MFLNGGSDIQYVNDSAGQANADLTTVQDRWRASWIVFNNLVFDGNPIFGPANSSFPYTAVTGRDIYMGGTGGGGHGNQAQCPDMSLSADCTAPPGNPAGFEGMLLAHEEIRFNGNVTLDGFIIAEDAAQCSDQMDEPSLAGGSVQIHYDCLNPPDPWGQRSVHIVSWQEIQQ